MIPASTSAARLMAVRSIVVGDVPVPEPADGEVVIRVLAVGLCGSDAHWYEEGAIGDSRLQAGLILGHEFCGVIETGPRAGERVAVDPAVPCLVCEQCREGRHNICVDLGFAGHRTTDGALRGHMVWPERFLVPLPSDMSDAAGALLEPLGVALHAVDLARVDETSSVGVIGCGPIGLLIVTALQARGIERITASDPLDHRVRAAGDMAADAAEGIPSGAEFDVVFETAGTEAGMAAALSGAKPGGRVVEVGIPPRDHTTMRASVARRKELTIVWCRRMATGDLARAAELGLEQMGRLDGLVSHRYGLGDATAAFKALADRVGLKILVSP